MIVGYGRPSAVISGSVSAALRRVSSASRARTRTHRLSSADTPSRRCEAWAARPGTVSRNVIAPAWAMTTSRLDGSVMIGQVAGHAGPDRREHPLAAVLLGRHERDEELAGQPIELARRGDRPDRAEDRGHAALHVAGAAAVQLAVADRRRPTGRRSRSPDRRAARRRRGPTSTTRRPPGRPTRPMTIGSAVRGISSPGQSGSARTRAGSGATAPPRCRLAQRRRPPAPRPPPPSR